MCGAPERRPIGPTRWIRRVDVGAWPTSFTGNNAAPILMAGAIAGRHRRGESPERVRDLGRGPDQDRVRVTNAGHSARVVAARLLLIRRWTWVEHRSGLLVCENERCDRDPRDAAAARSALGNAEVVSRTTPTISAEYAGRNAASNSTIRSLAITQLPTPRCAQARSMPEAAENPPSRSARSAEALTAPSTAPKSNG
jgi:hypothetical protein